MSEMCCTRLAVKYRTQKIAKNRHLRTIEQLSRAISSQHGQQYLLHRSSQSVGDFLANFIFESMLLALYFSVHVAASEQILTDDEEQSRNGYRNNTA